MDGNYYLLLVIHIHNKEKGNHLEIKDDNIRERDKITGFINYNPSTQQKYLLILSSETRGKGLFYTYYISSGVSLHI